MMEAKGKVSLNMDGGKGSLDLPVYGGTIGPEYRDIFAFVILIVVLIFKPAGLLGEAITEETLVYKKDY